MRESECSSGFSVFGSFTAWQRWWRGGGGVGKIDSSVDIVYE